MFETGSHNTVAHILGDHTPTPPDALPLCFRHRVLKSLLQLSSLRECLPKELLLTGPPSKTARVELLAEESLLDGISLEKLCLGLVISLRRLVSGLPSSMAAATFMAMAVQVLLPHFPDAVAKREYKTHSGFGIMCCFHVFYSACLMSSSGGHDFTPCKSDVDTQSCS